MAYGLIYTHEFDSFKELPYLLEIYKKDYVGGETEIIGDDSSIVMKWAADNPMEPIKGCSLEAILINKNANIPLSSFYGNDDTFYGKFIYGADYVLFEGYLVQDDCREVVIDQPHEIALSFTDNLGLLKDVSLFEASQLTGEKVTTTEDIETFFGSEALIITDFSTTATAGDTVLIEGTGTVDGYYLVRTVNITGGGTQITIHGVFLANYAGTATVTVITPIDLSVRLPLSAFYRMCLRMTGLELDTHIYTRLYEITGDTSISFIEETYLQPETFLDGDVWKSCWDVLTIINKRFGISMFQSNGVWNITRPHERRYYNNECLGFIYGADFVYVSETNMNDTVVIERNTPVKWEYPLDESILRPYRFAKETFKYRQPKNVLCNADYQDLGDLIDSYPNPDDPTQTFDDYAAVCWQDGNAGNLGEWLIRVVKNDLDEEIDRVMVIGNSGVFPSVVRSAPIEVNVGDEIEVSFDFRTTESQVANGAEYNDFRFEVEHSTSPLTDYRRMNNTGTWQTSPYFRYYWPAGTNTNTWNTVTAVSKGILFDGHLYIYLSQADFQGGETHYRNIRFTIKSPVNGTTKIIGHTHTDTQNENVKNNTDEEIYIDDTGRNWIAGTMFKESFTGLLQDRTKLWNVGAVMFEDLPLGHITTRDNLFWRRISRSKLEGTVYGVVFEDYHVSMLTSFKANDVNGYLNYSPGSLTIDFKKGKYDLTLWEMFNDYEYQIGTVDFDLLIDFYECKYLFEKQ